MMHPPAKNQSDKMFTFARHFCILCFVLIAYVDASINYETALERNRSLKAELTMLLDRLLVGSLSMIQLQEEPADENVGSLFCYG